MTQEIIEKDQYKKCILCDKRFKVQPWKVGVERIFNLLCFCKFKMYIEKIATPKERKVLQMRFIERAMLEEVGKELGVTRERVRQIEARALENTRLI